MKKQPLPWQDLLERSRQESAPPLDVAKRVMGQLQEYPTPKINDWPVWSATGISVAAALWVMGFVSQAGMTWDDPLGDWLSSLVMVMS